MHSKKIDTYREVEHGSDTVMDRIDAIIVENTAKTRCGLKRAIVKLPG
jgi:hypothetical protein